MRLLKDRKIAILITIFVIILATLFGVGRSLNRLARDVEKLFYDGIYLERDGFTQPGINSHLENIKQAALDCSSLFANHTELSKEAEGLILARREMLEAGSISEKHAAYVITQKAFSEFISKASTVELSERDQASVALYTGTFTGAMGAIESSSYNTRVRNYMDDASFIAFFLRPFVFVKPPQAFGK